MLRTVRRILNRHGFDISRHHAGGIGLNPYDDMRRHLLTDQPLIIDAGANVGQTAARFKREFPNSTIHSFEPSPTTFAKLQNNASNLRNVFVWNMGLASSSGTFPFRENELSDMSSFLEPGDNTWGRVAGSTQVEVITLDEFCTLRGIGRIDVLKSDTQGYDLEVLKGASLLLGKGYVDLVYTEVLFREMYRGAALFDEIFRYLYTYGFGLVSVYSQHYQNDLASWADALFARLKQ
jgi:FkbM family methyltransferase